MKAFTYFCCMKIVPFQSVGDLNFTDTRQMLRDKINQDYQSGADDFEGIKEYYDFYPQRDMLIYFDANDRVNAFEFFSPEPEFRDIDMLAETYTKLIELFTVFDMELIADDSGFDSPTFGITVHAPYEDSKDDMPESVLVYREGYYDE
ncbi:hypothetical protein GCM10028826_25590 [Mucilaginibacter boryungensis]